MDLKQIPWALFDRNRLSIGVGKAELLLPDVHSYVLSPYIT